MVPRGPTTLVFQGISLEQIRHWVEEKRIPYASVDIQAVIDSTTYTRPPPKYETATWPASCNLRCWHCAIVVGEQAPKFVPRNVKLTASGLTCEPIGIFNTWGCAAAYLEDSIYKRPAEKNDAKNLLAIVCSRIVGSRHITITAAPPKTVMEQYCGVGGLTQEEYLAGIPL